MKTLRTFALGLGLLGVSALQAVSAAPPATKLITAPLVSPGSAWTFYGTGTTRTTSSAAWNTASTEIALLARSLGANRISATVPQPAGTMSAAQYRQNVFDYVRNSIETEFRFGLGKGARGALIDQSGTSFDQAELMVKLLRAGGVTAGFRVGTITLTPAQFGAWTGLVTGLDETAQTFTVDAAAACQFLADGGIPATVNGATTCTGLTGNLTGVVMGHAWVAAGTTLYDPAFKRNRLDAGIDIAAGMGCGTMTLPTCGEGIRSQMMVGVTPDTFAGVPSINNPNRTALSTRLRTYATALETTIKTSHPGAELVDIVGGIERDIAYSPTVGTSLPYTSSAQYSWSGEIPNQFRTTVRVRVGTYDFTFYADEIAARRVRLMSWTEFFIDKTLVASAGCTGCVADAVVLNIGHPYAANSGAFADTQGEFLMVDLEVQGSSNRGTPPITIVHGFGVGGPSAERYVSELQAADPWMGSTSLVCGGKVGGVPPPEAPGSDGWVDEYYCENASQPTLAAKLLSQGSRADKIVEGASRANLTRHHNIGIVYGRVWGPTSLSFISVQSAVSIASRTNNAAGRTAAFEGTSAMWSVIEGSLYQQMADQNRALGVSADFMFRGGRFLDVAPANMAGVLSTLNPWSTYFWWDDRKSRLQDAANNGYSTIMTTVAPGSGGSIFYTSTASSYAVYEGAKGGSALGSATPEKIPLKTVDEEPPSWLQANKSSVSLATGELTLTAAPDLVTGAGDFPDSLSFQRTYRSGGVTERTIGHYVNHWWPGYGDNPPANSSSNREYQGNDYDYSAKLGGGWTHNLEATARYGNDGAAALGAHSGLDAASVIAGVFALTDAAKTSAFSNRLATMFGSAWVGERFMYNHVTVSVGGAPEAFHRLVDGTFNSPKGSNSRLIQTGEIDVNLRDYLPITFRYIGGSGDEMTFDYSTRSWNGASFNPAPPLFKANTWTFPDGVIVTFGYSHWNTNVSVPTGGAIRNSRHILTSVSNNLGRRINLNSQAVVVPSGDMAGGWLVHGYKITSVTDENSRSATFNLTGCTGDQTWACPTFTATSAVNAISKYEYVADAASPDPAVIKRPNYQLRRWYVPSNQTTPFATVRFDDLFRVQHITDVTGRVTNFYPGSLFGGEFWTRGQQIDAASQSDVAVFDDWGNTIMAIDGLGRVTRSEFDDENRLTRTINPDGDEVIRTYDVRSNLLTVTKRAKSGSGLGDIPEETYTYVEGPAVRVCTNQKRCNRVATSTSPLGQVTSLDYSATTGQALTMTMPTVPLGTGTGTPRTTYCYTTQSGVSRITGKIERVNASATRVTSFAYNSANKFVLTSATLDPSTTLSPPAAGVMTCPTSTKTGALNLVTSFGFDGVGNVTSINGARTDVTDVTNYRWDAVRRLTRVDAPLNSITRHTYDIDGQRRTMRRAIVATPTDANPANPSPSDLVASHWNTQTLEYWPTGKLRSRQDAQGNLTQYTYDAVDRLTLTLDPDSRGKGTVYDAAGQTLCAWKGLGSTAPTTCTWDPATYVAQGSAGPLRYAAYAYSANGKQNRVMDAGNNITDYVLDGHDRIAFTLFPHPTSGARCTVATPVTSASTPTCSGGTQQTYEKSTFDAAGNRLTLRTRKADTLTWTFDNLSRVRTKAVSGTPTLGLVTYGYNLLGEPMSLSSPVSGSIPAHSVAYDYDGAGRKLYEENLLNGVVRRVSYQFNATNRRSRVTWPDGYFVHYTYDANDRMEYARENSTTANELARHQYDQLSRLSELRYAGVSTNRMGYTYELDSNLDVLTNVLNATSPTLDYNYNGSGQIRGIVANDDFFVPAPAGSASTAYTPDRLNRYSAVGSDPVPTYDLNGNLLTWGPTATRNTYTYDAENRLRTVSITGGSTTTYDYDALGRRISAIGLTSTFYLVEGDEEVAEYSSAGAVLRRYIPGALTDGRIAATADGALTTPVKTYYHVNHQRSVIAMTNSAGSATGCAAGTNCQRMSYDEYGNLSAGSVATGQPYRYTGRRFDAESGLYYYRARYYSPTLGRFLSVDPIGYSDNVNLYSYVHGDPVNFADPKGTDTVQYGGSFGGVIGPFAGALGFGVAVDDDGNVGLYVSAQGGPAIGTPIAANVSGEAAWSNGDTIADLGGTSNLVSVSATSGLGGTVEQFQSTSGPTTGTTASLNAGAGATISAQRQETVVVKLFNVNTVIEAVSGFMESVSDAVSQEASEVQEKVAADVARIEEEAKNFFQTGTPYDVAP